MANVCKNDLFKQAGTQIEARTPIFSFQILIYTH